VEWIHVTEDKVVGSCEHGNEPLCFMKCGEFLAKGLLASQEALCLLELVKVYVIRHRAQKEVMCQQMQKV
jgi:hypothetical protein